MQVLLAVRLSILLTGASIDQLEPEIQYVLNDNECNPNENTYGRRLQTSNWPLPQRLLRHGYSPNAVVCDLDHTLEPQSTHSLVRYRCSHCSPPLLPDWSSRLAVVGEFHLAVYQ